MSGCANTSAGELCARPARDGAVAVAVGMQVVSELICISMDGSMGCFCGSCLYNMISRESHSGVHKA